MPRLPQSCSSVVLVVLPLGESYLSRTCGAECNAQLPQLVPGPERRLCPILRPFGAATRRSGRDADNSTVRNLLLARGMTGVPQVRPLCPHPQRPTMRVQQCFPPLIGQPTTEPERGLDWTQARHRLVVIGAKLGDQIMQRIEHARGRRDEQIAVRRPAP